MILEPAQPDRRRRVIPATSAETLADLIVVAELFGWRLRAAEIELTPGIDPVFHVVLEQ